MGYNPQTNEDIAIALGNAVCVLSRSDRTLKIEGRGAILWRFEGRRFDGTLRFTAEGGSIAAEFNESVCCLWEPSGTVAENNWTKWSDGMLAYEGVGKDWELVQVGWEV